MKDTLNLWFTVTPVGVRCDVTARHPDKPGFNGSFVGDTRAAVMIKALNAYEKWLKGDSAGEWLRAGSKGSMVLKGGVLTKSKRRTS